ncbi:MAG: hypothetical protein GF383_04245 [Candidatus Lokiarchaeota archaeon]|nr:hypothetical protein [Candidatus Lokiarchaeota archaeon]MBD3338965.1 hypothetical protein [Candidatus Lokiarchaeota archaeon]
MSDNYLIDRFSRFKNGILNLLISDPFIIVQMIIFLICTIIIIIFCYYLLVKKKPVKFYKFISEKDKKIIYITLFLCFIVSFLWDLYFFAFTKDDAFITFRYSKNFVNGHGIVFNRKGDPVEGYSNFLWVLLSTIPIIFNLEIVLYTKIFSIVLSFFTIIVLYKFTALFYDEKLSLIAPTLYALYYPFHLWTVGCLETPLFVLLILCSYYFAYKEISKEKSIPTISVLFSSLLFLARPEGIIFVLGLEGSILLYYLFFEKDLKIIKQRIFSILLVSGGYCVYFVWRLSYYGYPFPNSYYLKRSIFISMGAIEYVLTFLVFTFPIIVFSIFGAYKMIKKEKNFKNFLFLIVPILLNIALTLNLDAFNAAQGFRYLLPSMPFIIVFSVKYFKDFHLKNEGNYDWLTNPRKKIKSYLPFFFIFLLVLIPLSAPIVHKNVTFNDVNEKHYLLSQWFDEYVDDEETVAYIDMGIVPYYCDLDFIDMWGLMDEQIAHEGFSVDYILDQEPTFILFKVWGPDFSDDDEFEANYTLFFEIECEEINSYMERITYDLSIYKINTYHISNSTLKDLFD